MRRVIFTLLVAVFVVSLSGEASATLLFTDNFEGNLSAWTGKNQGSHSGEIAVDPLNPSNHVLHFNQVASGGDIFTTGAFTSKIDIFRLTFDYLGVPTQGGASGDLGGFMGYTTVTPGTGSEASGTNSWLAGTTDNYPFPRVELPDTGQWVHALILFESTNPVHLMLEDFVKTNGASIAGDVYFDNIILHNPSAGLEGESSPLPEPATMLLLGSGLVGLGLGRFRKRRNRR